MNAILIVIQTIGLVVLIQIQNQSAIAIPMLSYVIAMMKMYTVARSILHVRKTVTWTVQFVVKLPLPTSSH